MTAGVQGLTVRATTQSGGVRAPLNSAIIQCGNGRQQDLDNCYLVAVNRACISLIGSVVPSAAGSFEDDAVFLLPTVQRAVHSPETELGALFPFLVAVLTQVGWRVGHRWTPLCCVPVVFIDAYMPLQCVC